MDCGLLDCMRRSRDSQTQRLPHPHVVKTKFLFVCSRNQWRSPTAETLFKNYPRYIARSAGTAGNSRVRVAASHLSGPRII
jgi:hypothetical protein